jgi:anti-sigma factor RsiW
MTGEKDLNSPIDPHDLIAYLDGEVDADTRQKIERCLAQDPQLLQRMREHQQAWDLLDELPREEVSDDFAQTTLQMVTVAAAKDVEENTGKAVARRGLLRVATGASLIVATLAGFWMASGLQWKTHQRE